MQLYHATYAFIPGRAAVYGSGKVVFTADTPVGAEAPLTLDKNDPLLTLGDVYEGARARQRRVKDESERRHNKCQQNCRHNMRPFCFCHIFSECDIYIKVLERYGLLKISISNKFNIKKSLSFTTH